MKNCKLFNKKSATGITLISLIITIIVILILAGVAVQMLLNQENLFAKANEAKYSWDAVVETEQTRTNNLMNILNDIDAFLKQNKDEPLQTIAEKKPSMEEAVTALSDIEATILEDDYKNKVVIPAGFGIASDSGTKVEQGIVIEDVNHGQTVGNQYVWIPIGEINVSSSINESGKINITLGRYRFCETGGMPVDTFNDITCAQPQTESYVPTTMSNYVQCYFKYYEFNDDDEEESITWRVLENAKAADLDGFVNSALSNGGYYIARYEAGIEGSLDNWTNARRNMR